jgi:hypothetical protein
LKSDDDGVGDGISNATNENLNIEEDSDDSKEDDLPNFTEDVNNMVVGVSFANSSSNHSRSSGKRKKPQQCTNKSVKKRRKVQE